MVKRDAVSFISRLLLSVGLAGLTSQVSAAVWDNALWDQAVWDQTTPTYQVTPVVTGSGTVDPSTVQTITEGEAVSFVIAPEQGYQLTTPVGGTCGGTLTGSTYTTDAVTANCSVEFSFELIPVYWSVTPSAGPGGVIAPSSTQLVLDGLTTQFTITPNSAYEIASVGGTCGGSLSGNVYTTSAVVADCSVEAVFSLAPVFYDVTPVGSLNGSISPSTVQSILEGETTTFTLTPNTNYELVSVGGTCGGSLTALSYTTDPITRDCSVVPVFELASGTVPPDAPSLAKTAVTESTASLTISPSAVGSDPISNYETQCSVEDLASRGVITAPSKNTPLSLGTWSANQQARTGMLAASKGRRFAPNLGLVGVDRGYVIRADFGGGEPIDFLVERASVTERGNRFITTQSMGNGYLQLLVRSDGNFVGSMVLHGVAYEARIEGDETIIYSSANGELAENPFENDTILQQIAGANQPSVTGDLSAPQISSSPTVITVGVLYDNWLRDNPIDLNTFIEMQILTANSAYQVTGLDLVFSVVGLANYQPDAGAGMQGQKQFITCGSTRCSTDSVQVNPSVSQWRNTVRADLVVQLVGVGLVSDGGLCGTAQLPMDENILFNATNLYQYGYSVNAYINGNGNVCRSTLVAHEMGHNLGLFHDRDTLLQQGWTPTSPVQPILPYAFGHKISANSGTVMAYSAPGQGIPSLSSPFVTSGGVPLGVPIDQPNPAFAAYAVDVVKSYYANMFANGNEALIPLPPTITDTQSSTTSISLDFLPALTLGRPVANSFTADCSGTTSTAVGSPITISGLQPGTSYDCSVVAINQFGSSAPSLSAVVTTQTQTYTVTPSAGAGGAISPSTAQQVAQGNTTSFTVTPDSGFNTDTVTGCGGSLVGTIYTTGPVSANCTVSASFIEQSTNNATVTATAGAGGSITPSGAQLVTVGDIVSFGVTPNADYRIASVSGCGGTLSGNTYTTAAITADCSVQALFSQETWRVSGLSTTPQFDGLPTGANFACSAIATNAAGNSPASNVVRFTTQAPSAPTVPVITNTDYGDGEVTLMVSVADTGGVPIDFYTADCGGVTATSDTSAITVTGLTNDVAYSCTVTATNTFGITSSVSSAVTVTPQEVTRGSRLWLYLLSRTE